MSTDYNTKRREDTLRKIRALMAKADDRAVTPEESEVFRAKADELITRYAVEEFELISAGRQTTSPEFREVDISWWFDDSNQADVAARGQDDMRSLMYSLFSAVYDHARVLLVPALTDYGLRTMKVAGYPGDLDYADLLFTSLMMQLSTDVNPYPDPKADYFDNLKLLREAGLSWPEVYRRMAARNAVPANVIASYPGQPDGQRDKMIRDYRALCKKFGVQQNYNHYITFRRSFATGFVRQVITRLYSMRIAAERQHSETTGQEFALVIRDIRKSIKEWLYEQRPDLRPKPQPPMDTVKKGRRVKAYRDTRKVDWAAVDAGRVAGDKADISGHHGKRVASNPRELEQ